MLKNTLKIRPHPPSKPSTTKLAPQRWGKALESDATRQPLLGPPHVVRRKLKVPPVSLSISTISLPKLEPTLDLLCSCNHPTRLCDPCVARDEALGNLLSGPEDGDLDSKNHAAREDEDSDDPCGEEDIEAQLDHLKGSMNDAKSSLLKALEELMRLYKESGEERREALRIHRDLSKHCRKLEKGIRNGRDYIRLLEDKLMDHGYELPMYPSS